MIRRGDVVMVNFPFASGGGKGKRRPAVVVQCDRLNHKLQNTVVVMVSSAVGLVGKEPVHFLVDPTTPEGASSGLSYPSAVKCENVVTLRLNDIFQHLGHLSDPLMQKLDDCLKQALDLV